MSNTKKAQPKTLDTIIAEASPAEQIVHVCVAGKLVAEHQELERELRLAQDDDLARSAKLSQTSRVREIARRIQRVEAQMREHTHLFRFRALSPRAWSDLLAAHPPRDGKREGFNIDTFPAAAISACCVEPEGMSDPEAVDRLLAVLSPAQQSEMFEAAWNVNNRSPKALTSLADRKSVV